MEKHIFKFGESSLAIIVPKRWVDKHGVKASDTIRLEELENGDLVMSAGAEKAHEVEKAIYRSLNPALLARWVGLHYMYGTTKLRLYSKDGFTQDQLDRITDKINNECHGFEITSESNNDVVIEDFTNIKEMDLDKITNRIRSLIEQEFREIKEGNPKTVGKIEKLVNRFYMLGVRYVNVTQARDSLRYLLILELLEGIADNINGLSIRAERAVFEDLHNQFTLSFKGLGGDPRAIEKVAELRGTIKSRISRSKQDRLDEHLLKEIADYSTRISEFGLKTENKGGEWIELPGV